MSNSKSLRRQRERLFQQQNGLCYWCKQPMVMFTQKKGESVPPNSCTLDHLESRYDPNRGTYADGKTLRHVAACKAYNEKRCLEETQSLPVEELWRRSRSYPVFYERDKA